MRLSSQLVGWILVLLGSTPFSHSAILGVPGQHPSIQSALDASASGDTVLVERGTYPEHLLAPNHGFTLMSHFPMTGDSADWLGTKLDGTNSGTCLTIPSTRSEWVRIHGMVIANGHGDQRPGGIYGRDSTSLELNKVILLDHRADGGGAAVTGAMINVYEDAQNFIGRNLVLKNQVQSIRGNVFLDARKSVVLDSIVFNGNEDIAWPGSFTCSDSLIAENIEMSWYTGEIDQTSIGGGEYNYFRDIRIHHNATTRNTVFGLSSIIGVIRNVQIHDNRQDEPADNQTRQLVRIDGESLDIDSVRVENNTLRASGALTIVADDPELSSEVRNLVVRGNRTGGYAVGPNTSFTFRLASITRVSIRNSLFTGNVYELPPADPSRSFGVGGPVLWLGQAGRVVEDVEISHNVVIDHDDHWELLNAMDADLVGASAGRAMLVNGPHQEGTRVKNCVFHDNQMDNPVPETDYYWSIGSAVFLNQGGFAPYHVENCSFTDNDDGGLFIGGGAPSIVRNCVFRNNKRRGIAFIGEHVEMYNTLIQGTDAELFALESYPSIQSALWIQARGPTPSVFQNITVQDCHVRNLFTGTINDGVDMPQNTFENFLVTGNTFDRLEALWNVPGYPDLDQPIIWMNSLIPEEPTEGTNNLIGMDPGFDPDLGSPWLAWDSPCIDAGTPDSTTHDIEDPANPGFALWPSQGILRNDIGYTGGPYAGTLEYLVAVSPPVTDRPTVLPQDFILYPAYPNPFNPNTTLSYTLARPMQVELSVYNLLGQKVRTLAFGVQDAGEHSVPFTAGELASGVYVVELKAGGHSLTQKMLLLK